MTSPITHYCPLDADDRAVCGHLMTESDRHMTLPTCAACVAWIAAEDAALDADVNNELAVPLDAEEAALAGVDR